MLHPPPIGTSCEIFVLAREGTRGWDIAARVKTLTPRGKMEPG